MPDTLKSLDITLSHQLVSSISIYIYTRSCQNSNVILLPKKNRTKTIIKVGMYWDTKLALGTNRAHSIIVFHEFIYAATYRYLSRWQQLIIINDIYHFVAHIQTWRYDNSTFLSPYVHDMYFLSHSLYLFIAFFMHSALYSISITEIHKVAQRFTGASICLQAWWPVRESL